MASGTPDPDVSAGNTKVELVKVSVVLNDLQDEGFVNYFTDWRPVVRRGGYCMTCHKSFSNGKINEHKRLFRSHFKNVFDCEICGGSIVGHDEYKAHRQSHTGDSKVRCTICGESFSQLSVLKGHYETHRGITYRCVRCTKAFLSQNNLRKHLRTHYDDMKCSCKICGLRFGQKNTLLGHMACHSGKWKYRCTVCGYVCNAKMTLQIHKSTHGESSAGRHCYKCGITFLRPSGLRVHLKQHETGRRKCQYCSASFKSTASLNMHVQVKHSINLQCEVCDRAYEDEEKLSEHLKDAHWNDTEAITCDLCEEKILNLEFSKKLHLIKAHGGFLKCRVCWKVCYAAETLSRHFKCLHPNHDTVKCETCGDIFLDTAEHAKHYQWCLRVTRKTTTDSKVDCHKTKTKLLVIEQSPECKSCRKKFPSLQELQNHLFSMECGPSLPPPPPPVPIVIQPTKEQGSSGNNSGESGERKTRAEREAAFAVSCTNCNLSFKNKLKLSRHIWHVHTPSIEKPAEANQKQSTPRRGSSDAERKSGAEKAQDKSVKKKQKRFSCLQCGKRYWKASVLEAHIGRRHSSKPPSEENTQINTSSSNPGDAAFPQSRPADVSTTNASGLPANQISIKIDAVGQLTNVCIPVVINSYDSRDSSVTSFQNNTPLLRPTLFGSSFVPANNQETCYNTTDRTTAAAMTYLPQSVQEDTKNKGETPTIESSVRQEIRNPINNTGIDEQSQKTRTSGEQTAHHMTMDTETTGPLGSCSETAFRPEVMVDPATIGPKVVNSEVITVSDEDEEEAQMRNRWTVSCFICDMSFGRVNALLYHLKTEH